VEADSLAQMEDVGSGIRDFPALGDPGLDVEMLVAMD